MITSTNRFDVNEMVKFSFLNADYTQGYWTPPEDEVQIPTLPQFDDSMLRNAPPQLLRGRQVIAVLMAYMNIPNSWA